MDTLKKYIESITDLSPESWGLLSDCLIVKKFKKNELLLKEGEICKSIFFISEGICKSSLYLEGNEINTAFYFENDFATNISSLRNSTKSEYSIKACEKVIAVSIDKDRLLATYSRSHQIETFGRKVLELIMANQIEHADSFKILTPQQRYDRLVATQPDLLQRISLTQIASYLGISRETLSRFRAKR